MAVTPTLDSALRDALIDYLIFDPYYRPGPFEGSLEAA